MYALLLIFIEKECEGLESPVFRVGTPNYFNSIGSRLVRPVCIVLPAPHSCLEILFWSVWILAVCM